MNKIFLIRRIPRCLLRGCLFLLFLGTISMVSMAQGSESSGRNTKIIGFFSQVMKGGNLSESEEKVGDDSLWRAYRQELRQLLRKVAKVSVEGKLVAVNEVISVLRMGSKFTIILSRDDVSRAIEIGDGTLKFLLYNSRDRYFGNIDMSKQEKQQTIEKFLSYHR